MAKIKVKRIVKFETGDIVPAGAIFISSVSNGRRYEPVAPGSDTYAFAHDESRQIFHYFLVEVEINDTDPLLKKPLDLTDETRK